MTARATARQAAAGRRTEADAEQGVRLLGRLGLAGRTGFYLILTGLTVRIALFGGATGHQADAKGALALISRPVIGKMAIAAVALGFLLFGVGRLIGAVQDASVSWLRRGMTALQGLFYVVLSYVPASFLGGNHQVGSQQQHQKTAARLLAFPGGRELLVAVGLIMIGVCAQQIHGAVDQDFEEGLDLRHASAWVRRLASVAGVVGITARALVFLPVGVFFIVSAIEHDPQKSYGTDGELLRLSGHPWGLAVLAVVSAGLAVFVVFSALETRYRTVISAR